MGPGSQAERLGAAKRSVMRVNPQKHAAARRPRTVLSCTSCRKRKVKCDRLMPCTQCVRLEVGDSCTYPSAPRTPLSEPESTPSRSTRPQPVEHARYVTPTQSSDDRPAESSNLTPDREGPDQSVGHCANHGLLSWATPANPQGRHRERSAHTDDFVQSMAPLSFRGTQQRTRYFGRSHWATTLGMFPDFNAHFNAYYQDKPNPKDPKFVEYLSLKRLKRGLKDSDRRWQRDRQNPHSQKLKELLPERNLAEHLLQLYFSTFEYTLRILHFPSFLGEWNVFWSNMEIQPDQLLSRDIFLGKSLALMACSGCFATEENLALAGLNKKSFMQMCHEWIEGVTDWLGAMTNHAQFRLDLLQIKCLLLLAKQGTAWEGDLVSLAAGSLIREAIMMGLHRDPSNFSYLSPYWAEIRKRLWLTILELELQTSLYSGIPLAISWDEFDCPFPSNIEDEDFSSTSPRLPLPQPPTTVTRMTFQTTLAHTLRTRMEVCRAVNRVRLSIPYTEVTAMSETLSKGLADAPLELRNISTHGASATLEDNSHEFRRSLFLFLNYRCLLALHRPFFLRRAEHRDEPLMLSRSACVQISLALLAQLEYTRRSSANDQPIDSNPSFPHILQLKGGMFRDDVFHAAITICYELRLQARDKIIDPFPGTISDYIDQSAYYQRMALFESVERAIKYFELKVRNEKRASKVFQILTILFTAIKSEVIAAGSSHRTGAQSDWNVLTVDDSCPIASRRCRELLAGESLNHPRTELGNFDFDSAAQGFDKTSEIQNLQPILQNDSQGLGLENLDLEWYFSLDPLSPFPSDWPELDPFMT